jgi:nitrile hydratase subunit alpha
MTTTSGSDGRSPAALRTEALEQLLTERGLIDPKAMDEIITDYEASGWHRAPDRGRARAAG